MGGWLAGLSEIKASQNQPAELELGLSLAKSYKHHIWVILINIVDNVNNQNKVNMVTTWHTEGGMVVNKTNYNKLMLFVNMVIRSTLLAMSNSFSITRLKPIQIINLINK